MLEKQREQGELLAELVQNLLDENVELVGDFNAPS